MKPAGISHTGCVATSQRRVSAAHRHDEVPAEAFTIRWATAFLETDGPDHARCAAASGRDFRDRGMAKDGPEATRAKHTELPKDCEGKKTATESQPSPKVQKPPPRPRTPNFNDETC